MLNDVLLIAEKHKKAAEKIFNYLNKKPLKRPVVAISGESGSGKSEIAHCLGKIFKRHQIRAKILHTDNYYNTLPLERPAIRKENNYESVGKQEYLWKEINEHINAFKNESKCTLPCIDLISEQVDYLQTNFSEVNLLIVDGLYAIGAKHLDVKVFIELTYHETKLAQLKRGKEKLDQTRLKVLEKEHQDVQSLKPLADILISKEYTVYET